MASCSSLLSEDELMCSICLDVFTNPATTPCGHNFCKACITKFWDSNDRCQCPMCKKTFDTKPDLFVNTFISELTATFRKSVPVKSGSSPDLRPAEPEMSCHVCTGTKRKALKSCLVCQTSYCETHLEPHLRVAGLKKHKLMEPVENLQDMMCEKHDDRPLELFCRTDQTCVCQFCTETDHKAHDTVPLEQEYEERKTLMKKTDGEVQQMIEERLEKVQEIKLSIETRKRDTERAISDSAEPFTALVSSIQRSQTELVQVIEEKQNTAEKQADGFIQDLEQEITELKRRSSELEKLLHSEDHPHLLQTLPSLLGTRPHTKDWSRVSVQSDPGAEMRVVSQLEATLNTEMEKLPGFKLKRILQRYAVDVTLDRDTAHPELRVSDDGKQVRDGPWWRKCPYYTERFSSCSMVLGEESFSSGRFYYEVQVGGQIQWDLGVARESINRKGGITLSPEEGYWTIGLENGDEYEAAADPPVPLSLREKPQKVGVFVDYEEGQVSFYNVEAGSHIYSFTGCNFTEKVYPFFCLGVQGVLILTAVTPRPWCRMHKRVPPTQF